VPPNTPQSHAMWGPTPAGTPGPAAQTPVSSNGIPPNDLYSPMPPLPTTSPHQVSLADISTKSLRCSFNSGSKQLGYQACRLRVCAATDDNSSRTVNALHDVPVSASNSGWPTGHNSCQGAPPRPVHLSRCGHRRQRRILCRPRTTYSRSADVPGDDGRHDAEAQYVSTAKSSSKLPPLQEVLDHHKTKVSVFFHMNCNHLTPRGRALAFVG
jgi:hypothetical protein